MNSQDYRKEELVDDIVVAFQGLIPPAAPSLFGAPNHMREIEPFTHQSWASWEEVPPDLVNDNYDTLLFFSPEAFHFFLPAYMMTSLTHADGFTVYQATHFLLKQRRQGDPRFACFTNAQKAAVQKFVDFFESEYMA